MPCVPQISLSRLCGAPSRFTRVLLRTVLRARILTALQRGMAQIYAFLRVPFSAGADGCQHGLRVREGEPRTGDADPRTLAVPIFHRYSSHMAPSRGKPPSLWANLGLPCSLVPRQVSPCQLQSDRGCRDRNFARNVPLDGTNMRISALDPRDLAHEACPRHLSWKATEAARLCGAHRSSITVRLLSVNGEQNEAPAVHRWCTEAGQTG